MEKIYKAAGKEGMLKVIMWSKIYGHFYGTPEFWNYVKDTAYEKLKGQDHIVKLVLDPGTKKVFGKVCSLWAFGRLVKPAFEGNETYFKINKGSSFEWMSWEDGKKLHDQWRQWDN